MRGEMNLREALSLLCSFPEETTLIVMRIGGHFRPESRVFVIELTDDELRQSEARDPQGVNDVLIDGRLHQEREAA